MEGNINNVYDRNFTYMFRNVRNDENSKSGKTNRQSAGENVNKITKGAPYKVEKLTKMANKAKMTNLPIIRLRGNKLLKGAH